MELTRQQLFEKIWTTPATRLSEVLGLSGPGLAKVCARHDIPVPPRGYWARRAAGYTDARPALPVGPHAADEIIHFRQRPAGAAAAATRQEDEFEQRPENRVVVRAGGPRHALVHLTATALRSSTPDQYGRLWGGRGALDVRVSKTSVTRALGIVDAVVRAAVQRGHRVEVKDSKSLFIVDGENIEFGIDERSTQQMRTLTPKEKLELARGGYVFNRYSYVPTGELSFHLKNAYWSRCKWSDRKKSKLEAQLNDILAGVAAAATASKTQRIEREKEEAEWRKREERRAQQRARIQQLDQWSADWDRWRRQRAFVVALKERAGEQTLPARVDEWLQWAEEFLRSSEPIARLLATATPISEPDEDDDETWEC